MTNTSYAFHIDWDNDGDFGDAREDISGYVQEAEWQIGYAEAYAPAAAPGWLRLTVDNADRRFSPGCTSSPLYGALLPMRYVRVQATHAGHTYTMFRGYLWQIEPKAGAKGTRCARLYCVDALALLAEYPLALALQRDKRADQIIDAIVQAVAWPPALSGYWVLGVVGHMALGETTRLGGARVYRDFETGRETFAHAGDTWFAEITTALDAIRDTCSSEYGRFHFTRMGKARFLDRHWPQGVHSVAAALDDSMVDLDYRKGMTDLHNEIIVCMNPRVEGAAGALLWEHVGTVLRLPANAVRTIHAVFVDAQGRRHGATTVIAPVPGADFRANNARDGTGIDYTYDARLHVGVTATAAGADITFRWGKVGTEGAMVGEPIYLTRLKLRGTPLKAFDPAEIAASDALSITRYQRRRLMVDAPLLNNPVTGYVMAEYVLQLHKDPVDRVVELTLGEAALAHIMACTLFDVVRIGEAQTALDGTEHFIIGEHHRVTSGGAQHVCTWRLEPLPPFRAWMLGTSGRAELGQHSYLGF